MTLFAFRGVKSHEWTFNDPINIDRGNHMLGIGMPEILIILVVALIVIGPKRLPELAKHLGKGLAEFKKAADDLQESVRVDLETERHKEFVEKYPHLIPDSESEEESEEKPEKGDQPKQAQLSDGVTPEPPPEEDPEISYSPEEIEGGVLEDEEPDA